MEGDFHEFPCWEVTHFVWMIAWGMGDSYGDGRSQFISTHMPQEGPSVLSLQLLEDKKYLRGEDYNVPKISMTKWVRRPMSRNKIPSSVKRDFLYEEKVQLTKSNSTVV